MDFLTGIEVTIRFFIALLGMSAAVDPFGDQRSSEVAKGMGRMKTKISSGYMKTEIVIKIWHFPFQLCLLIGKVIEGIESEKTAMGVI